MSGYPGTASLFDALAQLEGFGQPNAVPTLANNPLDLKNGDIGNGTLGSGITKYNSLPDGVDAGYNQIDKIMNGQSKYYNPDTTFAQFGNQYTGGTNPAYGTNLANMLGVTPDTTIGSYLNGNPSTFPSTPSSDNSSSTSGLPSLQDIWKILGGIGPEAQQASQQEFGNIGSKAVSPIWGAVKDFLTSSQLIMLIVGLLLIAAGLFSFKTTQNVISTTRKGIQAITP